MSESENITALLNALFPASLVRETAPGVYDHVFSSIRDASDNAARAVVDLSALTISARDASVLFARTIGIELSKFQRHEAFSRTQLCAALKRMPNTLWFIQETRK